MLSLLDNKDLLQNAQQSLVNTGKKKQAINLIEQISFCYISKGRKVLNGCFST